MNTYRELLNQLETLKKEIEAAREQEARLIAERVVELLMERDIPLREVLAPHLRKRRSRNPVKPKYWNPETGSTWAGRGRMPRWLEGKDLQQFRIDSADDEPR